MSSETPDPFGTKPGGGSKLRRSPIYKDASEIEKPYQLSPKSPTPPFYEKPTAPTEPTAPTTTKTVTALRPKETEEQQTPYEAFMAKEQRAQELKGQTTTRSVATKPSTTSKATTTVQALKKEEHENELSPYEAFLAKKRQAKENKEQGTRESLPRLDTDILPEENDTGDVQPVVVADKTRSAQVVCSQGHNDSGIHITVEVKLCRCLQGSNV